MMGISFWLFRMLIVASDSLIFDFLQQVTAIICMFFVLCIVIQLCNVNQHNSHFFNLIF